MLQLPDWLDSHAHTRGSDLAIVTPRARLTYAQLRNGSNAAAATLGAMGVARGQTAAIFAINPALQMSLMLALHRLGVTVCVMPPEAARRQAAHDHIAFDWFLTDGEERPDGPKPVVVSIEWLSGLGIPAERIGSGFANGEDISVISMTTGTTSPSKPLGYSVDTIEKRIILRNFGEQAGRRGEKTLILAGLSGMNGFHASFGCMWAGGTVYMGWTAEDVPAVIAKERIEKMFSSAPLLLRAANAMETNPADVSSLQHIYAGGDSLTPQLVRRVTERMCRNLMGGFSTNEAGKLAISSVDQKIFRQHQVGFLLPWVEAEAVDGDDNVLPTGTEGALRFRTPYMATGYINNAEATATYFKNGWFYPGDMGWVNANRMLIMSGRKSDFINTADGRFNPARLDHVFLDFPGIVEAAGFGVAGEGGLHEIWLALVAKGPVDETALRRFAAEKLGDRAPQHYLRMKQLPRNDGGKIVRRKLVEAVQTRAAAEA